MFYDVEFVDVLKMWYAETKGENEMNKRALFVRSWLTASCI